MITVIADFDTRVKEIELYFRFLENIINESAQLHLSSGKKRKIDPELHKVLKAHGFLIIYNLMESSIKKALEKLYEKLSLENIHYKDVRDELKIRWIEVNHNNFSQKGSAAIFNAIEKMANDIIAMTFDSKKVISGNIDAQKIREFASAYGFSERTPWQAKKGHSLHVVKTQRNDLAHGVVSFAQCGKQHTLEDLIRTKREVIVYMRAILKNVERYIASKEFLKDPALAVAPGGAPAPH